VMRDVERKIQLSASQMGNQAKNQEVLTKIFSPKLNQAKRLLAQKKSDNKKLYSLHEPNVDCISKGKARVRYEFGCKVSLTTTHKQGLVIASQSIAGNPYDGHTLKSALTKSEELTSIKIKSACVDKGYKGHGIDPKEVDIFISGQKRHNGKSLTRSIKKELKRRSAIEPMIGHMKNDGRLGLSRLKGIVGDQINAILVGAGHNLRLILNHIRKMMKKNPLWAIQLLQNFLSKILSRIFGVVSRIFCVLENVLMEGLRVMV
jgi:transposase, IS5 family